MLALRTADEMSQLHVGRPPAAARGAGHPERPRSRGLHPREKRCRQSSCLSAPGLRVFHKEEAPSPGSLYRTSSPRSLVIEIRN